MYIWNVTAISVSTRFCNEHALINDYSERQVLPGNTALQYQIWLQGLGEARHIVHAPNWVTGV